MVDVIVIMMMALLRLFFHVSSIHVHPSIVSIVFFPFKSTLPSSVN